MNKIDSKLLSKRNNRLLFEAQAKYSINEDNKKISKKPITKKNKPNKKRLK